MRFLVPTMFLEFSILKSGFTLRIRLTASPMISIFLSTALLVFTSFWYSKKFYGLSTKKLSISSIDLRISKSQAFIL
jgi:hypothetical protein